MSCHRRGELARAPSFRTRFYKDSTRREESDLPEGARCYRTSLPDTVPPLVSHHTAVNEHALRTYVRRFAAGTIIYRDGDLDPQLHVIRSGRVEITKRGRSLHKRIGVLGPGEAFGEMEVLLGQRYAATARVVEDAEIVVVPPDKVKTMLSANHDVTFTILRQLAGKLAGANHQIESLLTREAYLGIAHTLATIAEVQGKTTDAGYRVARTTNDDLATVTGYDVETVLSVLSDLSEVGLVRRQSEDVVEVAPRRSLERHLDARSDIRRRVRVLVVDDSPLFVKAILAALEQDPLMEAVGIASNGQEAVRLTRLLSPDVITMDVQMPVLGGLDAVRQIMIGTPTPILVVTSLAERDDGTLAFEALRAGALDICGKPTHLPPWPEEVERLNRQLRRLASVQVGAKRDGPEKRPVGAPQTRGAARRIALISSEGGPQALASLLSNLGGLRSEIWVLHQGMDTSAHRALCGWLAKISKLPLEVAGEEHHWRPGHVLFASHGCSLVLGASGRAQAVPVAPELAGDRLFDSLAKEDGERSVAVVLSGTRTIGAEGLRRLSRAGGLIFVLHPGDAMVPDLPRYVLREVPAARAVPSDQLPRLLQLVSSNA